MRWTKMFIPTLREDPAQVESLSQRLLIRAGFIRQLTAGVYSILPLGQRVRLKVIDIIRQEMNGIGSQEFALSALQPIELWHESGRAESVADIMFKLKDRKGAELALGLTHEEVFTSIARSHLLSYRQVPQMWYQIQTKFRDEPRPRGGLLRTREFTMKDSYSFDLTEDGLDQSFNSHREAYERIFSRCGLDFKAVDASSGAMGGSSSVEFMLLTSAGEDHLVLCDSCKYSANLEKASSKVSEQKYSENAAALEEFATPGIRTIRELEVFDGGAPAARQIKTLVFVADDRVILALVRGDQELNESKLQSALHASVLRQANDKEIFAALGAHPGSLGACGVKTGDETGVSKIIADHRLRGRSDMLTGANKDDVHFRNVDVARDIRVDIWADLHTVQSDELCTECGGKLQMARGLEIGHIFKLGTRYSEIMNVTVLDAESNRRPLLMGCYGIGVERLIAAVAEMHNDEHGLIWPVSIAPFKVLIVPINVQDKVQMEAAIKLQEQLTKLNIDTLLDDRDERAGVKFNDADLIGIPIRIVIGKKIGEGKVEFVLRSSKSKSDLSLEEAVGACVSQV